MKNELTRLVREQRKNCTLREEQSPVTFSICSIGCGSMATHVHGPAYRKYALHHHDVVLAACCDLDAHKAETFKMTFGFQRWYTDLDVMLDQEQPDAVCLVVPEHLTAPLSIRIMKKGYPLIIEKPPGLNKEETMRMIRAADQYDVPVQVAFNRRYMPLVRELKDILVGRFRPPEIHHIRYDFYRVGRLDSDFSATAIHGIDSVRFLTGSDYANIQFYYQPIPGFGAEVVNILMDCEMESGATARLSFFPVSGVLAERAVIHTHNHTFMLNLPVGNSVDYPGKLVHYDTGQLVAVESSPDKTSGEEVFETSGFYSENAYYFDDIRAGRRPAGDLSSALQSVEVADCIRKRLSVYTK